MRFFLFLLLFSTTVYANNQICNVHQACQFEKDLGYCLDRVVIDESVPTLWMTYSDWNIVTQELEKGRIVANRFLSKSSNRDGLVSTNVSVNRAENGKYSGGVAIQYGQEDYSYTMTCSNFVKQTD